MVVTPINQRYADRRTGKRFGGCQAAKATTDNHNMRLRWGHIDTMHRQAVIVAGDWVISRG